MLGDQFYLVALPWLVLHLTGSSLALGTIIMTAVIPRTALMLVGGAVTDRVSPRRVLMVTAASRTLLVGLMSALVWTDYIELWHLYVLSLGFGMANAFSVPAGATMIPSLVQPPQIQRANALMQSSTVMTQMAGAAAAGLAIKYWGVPLALLIDALSFLAVIVALLTIPDMTNAPQSGPGMPIRPNMKNAIGEGLRAVWNDRPLRALMVIFAAINFCVAGPMGIGLPTLAKLHFGSAAVFGTLLSCFAGGTLGGILLAGALKRQVRRGLQLIAVGVLAGLVLIAIGLTLQVYVIGALLALMGFGVGFVNVQFRSWIQMRVERSLMGRVISVMAMANVGLVPVSFALSGALAQWNPQGLFIAAGATLIAISAAIALTSRAAREMD